MKKFETLGRGLSKEEQKKILGGVAQSCSMTYQDPSGVWHTETGTCQTEAEFVGVGALMTPYCSTQSFTGLVPLSSNGGVSKCGEPYFYGA